MKREPEAGLGAVTAPRREGTPDWAGTRMLDGPEQNGPPRTGRSPFMRPSGPAGGVMGRGSCRTDRVVWVSPRAAQPTLGRVARVR